MTAYDGIGAEQLIDAWLAAYGDHDIDDEGGTLSDLLETVPEIRDDLQARIARALGLALSVGSVAPGPETAPPAPTWPTDPLERPSAFGEPHWSILNTAGLVCRCGCGGIFRFLTMAHVPVVFPACSFPVEGTHYSVPPPLGPVHYIGHAEDCPHRYGLDQAPPHA